MSDQRDGGIAWTDETWNPIRGCSRVSPGCENCYAERMAARFCGPGQPYEGLAKDGRWTRRVRLVEERLCDPLRWKRPRRVFVNSMSDLFHEDLDLDDIARVFAVMDLAAQHTFQVLTKRPGRMSDYMRARYDVCPAPDNIWLGVSVEDQQRADERIPLLTNTPAALRFISCEPLLGPVSLRRFQRKIGWVIAGCESGPGARPMDLEWVRSLRDQCVAAGVPFFFKQAIVNGRKDPAPWLDGRPWAEFPARALHREREGG